MTRTLLAFLFLLFMGSIGFGAAPEPIKLSAVEATTGPGAHLEEAVDDKTTSGSGWIVPPAGPSSAVFRPLTPIKSGRLRVYPTLYGPHGAGNFGEFSLSVTADPNPSLASHWDPLFPVTFIVTNGEISRVGDHLQIAGTLARLFPRIDSILPYDATGIKIDVWHPGDAREVSKLTELRVERVPIASTNIALGCPVTASHPVGAGQDPRLLTDGLIGTFAHPAAPQVEGQFAFEIDLGRVAVLDHISLTNRAVGAARLSRLRIELFDQKPTETSVPLWSAQHRADGVTALPGQVDVIRGPAGKGVFQGRYLRIVSESAEPYSPQIAEVEVYESLAPIGVEVSADGKLIPVGTSIRIRSDADWLSFKPVQPALPNGFIIGAQARIIGFHEAWVPIPGGGKMEYRGLPPGEYVFEANLRHTDFVWNEATFRIPLIVVPPWWRYPIVQVAGGLLAAALVGFATWLVARRRLKRRLADLERKHELANERRRIARDMHDVVGARLTQLAVMHELYAEQHAVSSESRDKLRQLSETAREALASLDQTVWAINPRNDTLQGVADYLCHTATTYLSPLEIACRQDVPPDWPDIPVSAPKRHGLLLAFKEALQNVVKHSGATSVMLTLRLEDHTLFVSLEDNGCGLPADLSGVEKDGLDNMSARLSELGGSCVVMPGSNGGTRVEMRLPLNVVES